MTMPSVCDNCIYNRADGTCGFTREIIRGVHVETCTYCRPSCNCGRPMTNYIDLGWTCDHCEEARSKRVAELNETTLRQQMRY